MNLLLLVLLIPIGLRINYHVRREERTAATVWLMMGALIAIFVGLEQ